MKNKTFKTKIQAPHAEARIMYCALCKKKVRTTNCIQLLCNRCETLSQELKAGAMQAKAL